MHDAAARGYAARVAVVDGADGDEFETVGAAWGDRDGTEYRCAALDPSTPLCMWRQDDNHGFVVMPGKSVDVTLDTMFRVRGQLEA